MRWGVVAITVWLFVLAQTTLGRVLILEVEGIGTIGPDLLAPLAVFAALYTRRAVDAMLAAAIAGFSLDLATAGAGGSLTVVGPMALAYAAAARAMYELREAFFRDRPLTRGLLVLVFCLIAHGLWVTLQAVLARGTASWSEYWRMLMQAGLISLYTALVAPFVLAGLSRIAGWLLPITQTRSRRGR